MALSRRGFLTHSTVSAASAPFLLGLGIDYCDASPSSTIDWSMGFPEGAVLLNRNENPIGPSPLAIEAANKGIPRSFRYADPDYIRTLLADHHDIDKSYLLVGAVMDRGCRDIEAMQVIGFPVFGKASVPYGPGNIIRPVAANVPVTCGKVEVHPGDLVAADSDGVIVVPKAVIDGLGKSIMERSAHEKEMRRKIDEGESLEEAYSL